MLFSIILLSIFIQPVNSEASSLELNAESAIIVDADTGKILYEKNADMELPPASMIKMMTEYLVWEAIDAGEISWDTETEVSDYAYELSANPDFSGIGLRQNVSYKVEELYEAMAINSDNATSVVLAELIAGSEGEFVKRMNEKAEEMGLPEYKFVNATGLENADLGDNYPEGTDKNDINLLSARSAALLAYHLIHDYPEALEISKTPYAEFEDQPMVNWNWMLPHEGDNFKQFYYEGVDGLKTGHTDIAKYCFTGTAEVDGKRLITVVMKTESFEERFNETKKLLDYGLNNFEMTQLFAEGDQLEDESTLPVSKGKQTEVDIAIAEGFELPIHKDEKDLYELSFEIDEELLNEHGELTAPVEKGQKVGEAKLVYEGDEGSGYIIPTDEETVDVVTIDSVEKSNWFKIALSSIGEFFSNLFSSAVDMIKGIFS